MENIAKIQKILNNGKSDMVVKQAVNINIVAIR